MHVTVNAESYFYSFCTTFESWSFHVLFRIDSNHPKVGDSMGLWNVCILPQQYNVSQPRRLQLETSPLWKPQSFM